MMQLPTHLSGELSLFTSISSRYEKIVYNFKHTRMLAKDFCGQKALKKKNRRKKQIHLFDLWMYITAVINHSHVNCGELVGSVIKR